MLRLRSATKDDWARLYHLRNDPTTRQMFASTEPVDLATHLQWLDKTLASEAVRLFIASDDEAGRVVGTVRIDIVARKKKKKEAEEWAEVSITVDARFRGQGYATAMIQSLVDQMKSGLLAGLIANVKPDNYASLRAFAECGFNIASNFVDANGAAFVQMERPF